MAFIDSLKNAQDNQQQEDSVLQASQPMTMSLYTTSTLSEEDYTVSTKYDWYVN